MLKYAVVNISNHQLMVEPNKEFKVIGAKTEELLEIQKVLLVKNEDKLEIGAPYLKNSLKFKVLGTVKNPKIRISTYKAKANTRKLAGSRSVSTRLILVT